MTDTEIPVAEILSQGEEVVCGQVTDTNAAWISQELIDLGFDVSRHTVVGDRLPDLRALLLEIAERADCCICTGGLGPTQDDLTTEAVSQAFGLDLCLDDFALDTIIARYARAGMPMPDVNRKQALLPSNSQRLDNHWGTAPGFSLRSGRCWFAFLPGVPPEMREMFRYGLLPQLKSRFALPQRRRVTLRCVGIGESALQERLDKLKLPADITVGFRVASPEVHVKLLFPANWIDSVVEETARSIRGGLGSEVFAMDGIPGQEGSLVATVGRLLQDDQATVAAVESSSGGLLASQCAGEDWFIQSIVMTETKNLCRHFNLNFPESPNAFSKSSEELAARMRRHTGADYALAQITEMASPTPIVHFALATGDGAVSVCRPISGGRERIQTLAAAYSLDLLRRTLSGLGPPL